VTDPVVVFRTRSPIEASIVRGLLQAHGYEAMLSPDSVWTIVPASAATGREIAVAVPADVAEAAGRLVESRRDLPAPHGDEPSQGEGFAALEARIGHRFTDRTLLEHALTHRSRAHEDITGGVVDNESLEFLGDAVVGLVIAEALYREYPHLDEGAKSKIRASLVSAGRLSRLGEALGLGEHLLLGRGEEKTGGRRKTALLADACEAIVAAIYLDAGLTAAAQFVRRELWEPFEASGGGDAAAVSGVDYKSALQELLQARGLGLPEYRVAGERGPEHDKVFEVELRVNGDVAASASGRSKKDAEQQAAQRALQAFA
jgi:ribonuclease-3